VDYHFFGAKLSSPIQLLTLPKFSGDPSTPAITLKPGNVPQTLDDPIFSSPLIKIAADKTALIRIEDIGAFYITSPTEIVLHADPHAYPEEIESILTSTVAGILLRRRNTLPLHASVVLHNNKAIAFTGTAALGKSALAAAYLRRHAEAELLADNLCALDLTGPKPAVHAGTNHLRLWPDLLDLFSIPPSERREIRPDHAPKNIALPAAPPAAYPLTHLFRLAPHGNRTQPELKPLSGPGAVFHDHRSLLYQQRLGQYFSNGPLEFRALTLLAKHVALFTLHRTRQLTHLDQCLDLVDESIQKAGRA
jgi:hypothetical protein